MFSPILSANHLRHRNRAKPCFAPAAVPAHGFRKKHMQVSVQSEGTRQWKIAGKPSQVDLLRTQIHQPPCLKNSSLWYQFPVIQPSSLNNFKYYQKCYCNTKEDKANKDQLKAIFKNTIAFFPIVTTIIIWPTVHLTYCFWECFYWTCNSIIKRCGSTSCLKILVQPASWWMSLCSQGTPTAQTYSLDITYWTWELLKSVTSENCHSKIQTLEIQHFHPGYQTCCVLP